MNPNFSSYRNLVFLLGLLGVLFFTAHQSASAIMYPTGENSFAQLFYGALAVGIVLGIIIPIQSFRGRLSMMIMILIMSAATIVAGFVYSFEVKTEEFLIYFLMNALSTLAYISGAVMLLKFILLKAGMKQIELLKSLMAGALGIILGAAVNYFSNSFATTYLWFGIVIFAHACITTVAEGESNSVKLGPLHLANPVKTMPLRLSSPAASRQ